MGRRFIFFVVTLMLCGYTVKAQSFDFELTGNPVDTTGWNMSDDSYIENDHIVLTDPMTSQAGYIYYATPQDLANCSQFTVTFEFRITNQSSPPADGIAFWYITNPPTNFVPGGGIGLPSDPNGLLLILDTYNNNGYPDDNPLVSLRRMTGNSDYIEGSSTGLLTPDLTHQNFITDGNWHTCELHYYFGTVTVSFDGNPPVMTGTTTLNISGYFGFSAGTGAKWSKHQIRNVSIVGAPEPTPPVTDTVFYCQYDTPDTLTAQPDTGVVWYLTPTGGAPLPSAPLPSTDNPGTYTWYVATKVPGCNIESNRVPAVVVVHPQPLPPNITVPKYCSGQTGMPIQNPNNTIKWYTTPTGGVGSSSPPAINTSVADTQTYYATQTSVYGCESPRDTVNVIILQAPVVQFATNKILTCAGDTVHFTNQTTFADSYLWRFGIAGFTDTSENTSHYYQNPGTYYVTLIAKNAACADSALKILALGHPLSASFSQSADSICAGTSVNFTNTSIATTINGIAPGYKWNFGDGNTINTENPSHTYNAPGVYQVQMVVNNGIPCYDTAVSTVIVDSLPHLAIWHSDTSICKGDKIVIKADYVHDGIRGIHWSFGDGTNWYSTDTIVHHAYDEAGIYTVVVQTDYKFCPNVADSFSIRVKNLPYLNIGADTTLCLSGAPLIIGDNTNNGNTAATWLWNTGDKTPTITVLHPGHYWERVTLDGCISQDDINISKDCYIDIPNSFTPNGDGINDYFIPRQLLSKGVRGFSMKIYNRWGEVIFKTDNVNGRGWDGRFNGKVQPIGVYVYVIDVVYKNGRHESYKGNVTLIR